MLPYLTAAMLGIDLDRADHGYHGNLRCRNSRGARACTARAAHGCLRHAARVDRLPRVRPTLHQEQVAYTCGSLLYPLYGGINARTGRRTMLEVNSIIATVGHTGNPGNTRHDYMPPLNNQTLFRRDAYLLHVLRHALCRARAVARPHPALQPGRHRHLDQRRRGLPPLQQSEGLAHARSRRRCSSSRCRSRRPMRSTSS